ncbi:transcriptional regulator, IclR family [Polaromonas sp. OV174]|nr:transcriptional regulator, IclR family [Polaromonas sp. OV174]
MARGAKPGEVLELSQPMGAEEEGTDTQFVSAVGRAMAVLSAFRPDDGPLGNAELSERTGLPKPTVSRLTYTLARCGCLTFNPRYRVYQLGPAVVAMGHAAMKSIDVRQLARPLIQQLAHQSNFNVGLAARDEQSMVYLDAFEGNALVGLRLPVGFRLPILTSSMGRAYLAGLPEDERELALAELRPAAQSNWTSMLKQVKEAVAEYEQHGFCTSIGEWRSDVNGVAAPIRPPAGGPVYAVNLGGPAYLLSEHLLREELGPKIAELTRKVEAAMTPIG